MAVKVADMRPRIHHTQFKAESTDGDAKGLSPDCGLLKTRVSLGPGPRTSCHFASSWVLVWVQGHGPKPITLITWVPQRKMGAGEAIARETCRPAPHVPSCPLLPYARFRGLVVLEKYVGVYLLRQEFRVYSSMHALRPGSLAAKNKGISIVKTELVKQTRLTVRPCTLNFAASYIK